MTNWQPQWVKQLNRLGELSDYDKLQEKHQKASKVVAQLKYENEQMERKNQRLHNDIRKYDAEVKKQQMIIQIQSEIIKQYSKLCNISNAEFWIETENGCERI